MIKPRKIIKVKRIDKRADHWKMFRVWFEGIEESTLKMDMFESQFNLMKFEDGLLRKGIDFKDIREHRYLVQEYICDEQVLDYFDKSE